MSDNSKARQALEQIYGKGCMFKKAHIEEQIYQLKTIKTYKVFLQETRYTGKKIRQLEKNMTYHHLRHDSEGGKATVENGAIVNELAHRYLHSLPRDEEEIINNMLRHFKLQGGISVPTENGLEMEQPVRIDINFGDMEDCIIIPTYNNTKEDFEKREKFNRAKAKREFQKQVDEALYSYEDDERY